MSHTNGRCKRFVPGVLYICDDNFDVIGLKKSILKAADGRNLECSSNRQTLKREL